MLAYHIDLKRAMWSFTYLLDFGKKLKELGYTHILLEIEDKFRFRNHPGIAHPDAFSHEQYRALTAEYGKSGLKIFPLLQTLGHSEAVTSKPAYAHLREQESVTGQYDPVSREVHSLLFEFIDELIEVLQPESLFHIGGDETWELGKSEKLQDLVGKVGIGGLYLRHMLPLLEHVRSRGLRPVIWADMVLTYPEILPEIPGWVLMMDWDYKTGGKRTDKVWSWTDFKCRSLDEIKNMPPGPVRDMILKYGTDAQTREDNTFLAFPYAEALRDAGFDVITASANRSSGDSAGTPQNKRHLPNVFFSAQKGRGMGGNTVTSWAVRHNHPRTHWAANNFAAAGWNYPGDSYDEEKLASKFTERHFGLDLPEFYQAMKMACRTWASGQASAFPKRAEALKRGENPFEPDILELAKGRLAPAAAAERLKELREGYAKARESFHSMAGKATRNRADFEYWIEGIDFNLFHADCLIASMEEDKPSAGALKKRAGELRARTRKLFMETYEPASADEEVGVRYDFLEAWLSVFGG